jgi:hypothetical protein
MSKITGIRQNLRRENHDADSVQGNPGLLVKSSIKEAGAPASNTIGIPFEGICLFSFIIPDTAPNVPDVVRTARHNAKDGVQPEQNYRSGLYRIACHGMPTTNDASTTFMGSPEESLRPDPLLAKSREEYYALSKLYPVYVGEYIDEGGNHPEASNMMGENLMPGSPLLLVDNDVQGGVYGSIIMKFPLPDGMPPMQFAPAEIRALFSGGEGPIVSGPLDDHVLEQYRLQDPSFWTQANIIDSSQPWSALDSARNILGAEPPFDFYDSVASVSESAPVPELYAGWSVVQRWSKLNLGTNTSRIDDDSVIPGKSKGHTYLVHKNSSGQVTVVQSSKSLGYRRNVSSWGGTDAGGFDATGYSVGVQPLRLADQEGFDVLTGEFNSWASANNLPCCTFVAAFLREASSPGEVSFETPTES